MLLPTPLSCNQGGPSRHTSFRLGLPNLQSSASIAPSYADDFETVASSVISPQPALQSLTKSQSLGGASPGLRLSARRNTVGGTAIPEDNSMTEIKAIGSATRQSATAIMPSSLSRRPSLLGEGQVQIAGGPVQPSLSLHQEWGSTPSTLLNLAQSTLLRYQSLLANGSLNLPRMNPMEMAGMRPFHGAGMQALSVGNQLNAGSELLSHPTLPMPSIPFGLDAASVASVRMGLLGTAAKAAERVSASDMVSERVADSDLRQDVDRLRQRLLGAQPWGQRPGSAAPSLGTRPRGDREVTLDPVTRQLVNVGPEVGGYRYTTFEDTMRMIRAHRNGGPVAIAWG